MMLFSPIIRIALLTLWISLAVAASAQPVVRVNTTSASTGSGASNSWTMIISPPANGDILIAAINVHASVASPAVTDIMQAGATWTRAAYSDNPGNTVTEIWYATNVSNASTNIIIATTSAWRQAAVVAEYSGINAVNPVDVTATSSGTNTTTASTGTTTTTFQTNELWFGAIGLPSSSLTLGTPSNGFGMVTNANSNNANSSVNANIFALEKIVNISGNAGSGGTLSSAANWSGLMVTFEGSTSPPTSFTTLTTNQIASLLVPYAGVHPRLMINAAQLADLRARTNDPAYSKYWNSLVAYAQSVAGKTPPAYSFGSDLRYEGDYIHGMAFEYLISGDTNVLAGAVKWATNLCNYATWDEKDVRGNPVPYGLAHGHWLVGLAALYDYAYNDLSPEVRQSIYTNLMVHGAEQYSAFANGTVGPIYLSNQWWLQGSGVLAAGLVTFDQPGNSNALNQIWLMEDGFAAAAAMLSPDGWHQEGPGYWQYGGQFLLQAFEWSKQLLGVDYFAQTASGWGANAGTFTFDFMVPHNSWAWYDGIFDSVLVPFEDTKLDSPGPAIMLRGLAHFYGDGHAQWFADQLEKVPNLNSVEPAWAPFYWYDPSVMSIAPTNLPTCHVFTNTAIVSSRTDWSGNEALLTFKCGGAYGSLVPALYANYFNNLGGDPMSGHTHPDAGSFSFFGGGDWLICEPGYYQRNTLFENTLIVDGNGQYGQPPSGYPNYDPLTTNIPSLTYVSSTPALDEMVGQAAPAYNPSVGVLSFQRHILFAKPDVLLVADQVQMNNASHNLHLYFHSLSTNAFVKQADGSLITTDPLTTSRFDLLTPTVSTMTNYLQNITERSPQGGSNIMTLVDISTSGRTNWQNVMVFSWTTNGGIPAKATLLFTNGDNWVYQIGSHIVNLNWSAIPTTPSPVVMSTNETWPYGLSSTISATVTNGPGTVQFYVDGTNFGAPVPLSGNYAALPSTAKLPAGIHTVMGVYSNSTTHLLGTAANEVLLTVTPIPVGVAGARVYDATTNIDTGILTTTGNLDGANLGLAGSGYITNKNVGSQPFFTGLPSPARVNVTAGFNTQNGVSFSPWVTTIPAPENGNTLIAAINVHASVNSPAVTSIAQAGANWVRAAYSANPGNSETEIWYATNVQIAGTSVAINLSTAWRSAAVIAEYRGLAANPLDVTASDANSTVAADTGTTPMTSQPDELWFGCIGTSSSAYTLDTDPYGFLSDGSSLIASAKSDSSSANANGNVMVSEKFVGSTGHAVAGGNLSPGWIGSLVTRVAPWSGTWSGVMATFKIAQTNTPLILAGPAAGNYTLGANPGTVSITSKPLTVTGITANNKIYDGTATATLNQSSAALVGNLDSTNVVLNTNATTGTFLPDGSVGTNKTVQISGLSLSGSAANNYQLIQPSTTASIATFNVAMTSADNPHTITFTGNPGVDYITQRSTNLVNWTNISTNTAPPNGQITILDKFADLGSNQPPASFYRVFLH